MACLLATRVGRNPPNPAQQSQARWSSGALTETYCTVYAM
jgi:hypothetical protein